MTPFDLICIVGAICGASMVIGGLVLFYKGILTLEKAPDENSAVSVEFQRILKIQSRYPAYGFFIIGLAVIVMSAWFSKPGSPVTA